MPPERVGEGRARSKRAHERLLRGLSDAELHALNDVGPLLRLLRPELSEPLEAVSFLAFSELNDREFEADRG